MSRLARRAAARVDPRDEWLWTWPIWTFGLVWLAVMLIAL